MHYENNLNKMSSKSFHERGIFYEKVNVLKMKSVIGRIYTSILTIWL